MSFHDVEFPLSIGRGSSGGPSRKTQIVAMNSGREQRNSEWANSRRKYNVSTGIRNADDLSLVIDFWEARRGRLYGFLFKDAFDFTSSSTSTVTNQDQSLGTGDGEQLEFQLVKRYTDAFNPYTRKIYRPVASSVQVSVAGAAVSAFTLNDKTGIITFATPPAVDAEVKAGFEYYVPVRFDIDEFIVSRDMFDLGSLPEIPLIEVIP